MVEPGEECESKGTTDWMCASCKRTSIYTPCSTNADCFGEFFGKKVSCNTTYAVCTIPCSGLNSCPAAANGLDTACIRLGSDPDLSCVAYGCKGYTDCAPGGSCVPYIPNDRIFVCFGLLRCIVSHGDDLSLPGELRGLPMRAIGHQRLPRRNHSCIDLRARAEV